MSEKGNDEASSSLGEICFLPMRRMDSIDGEKPLFRIILWLAWWIPTPYCHVMDVANVCMNHFHGDA